MNHKDSIDSSSDFSVYAFSNLIYDYLNLYWKYKGDLIFLCIGTDRATGDCLGPLIGNELLRRLNRYKKTYVLGNLENPVHAKNIDKTVKKIYAFYENPFIIAIDSSLGSTSKVGYINIKKGSIKPGAGVNKNLQSVGDISITGIVNIGGMMETLVLQSTRLSLVMSMSNTISRSISLSLYRLHKENMENKKTFQSFCPRSIANVGVKQENQI